MKLLATLALVVGLVGVPGACANTAAVHPLRYGVADDWPQWHDCGDVWWQSAKDVGFQDLRLTVQWDETQPTVVPNQTNLQAAVDCAVASDVRPILAIYPLHAAAIGPNAAAQAQFAAFVAQVGTTFPQVQDFIVGNEPNVNRFWQPQYVNGQDAAATDYEHTLAASYDALKAARPDAIVWGPAISSRGNDNPYALSNPSHSPVWFIKYLGDAYRASGRTKPIFDEFDMHPYPSVQDTAPFSKQFDWPQAGAADLSRIKQALWDAFHDTAQPLPAEYGGGRTAASGLPIDLDEVGEQTTVDGHEQPYVSPGESVIPIDEATQAARYVQLAQLAACDPDVKTVMWFPLIDDTTVSNGFQSGLVYADLAHKLSYGALKNEIATSGGSCRGGSHGWVHSVKVSGASGLFAGPGTLPGSQPTAKPAGVKQLRVAVTTAEDATYIASLVPAVAGVRQAAAARSVGAVSGTVRAYHKPPISLAGPIPAGKYRVRIVVAAATNPDRTMTLTSRAFTVAGAPHKKK